MTERCEICGVEADARSCRRTTPGPCPLGKQRGAYHLGVQPREPERVRVDPWIDHHNPGADGLSRNRATLREHVGRVADTSYPNLTPEDAAQMGYSRAEIEQVFGRGPRLAVPGGAELIEPVTVFRGKRVEDKTKPELVAALSEMCWRWECSQADVGRELDTGCYRRGAA